MAGNSPKAKMFYCYEETDVGIWRLLDRLSRKKKVKQVSELATYLKIFSDSDSFLIVFTHYYMVFKLHYCLI